MFTRVAVRAIIAAACVCLVFATLPAEAEEFALSQVDFYQDGLLHTLNSEWGQFDIAYSQTAELRWVNLVSASGTWLVQNHPLLPSSVTGTSAFTSTSFFDLGSGRGAEVTALDVVPYVSDLPWTTAQDAGGGTSVTAAVGDSQDIVNSGVPSAAPPSLNSPGTGNVTWNPLGGDLVINWHRDMPNVIQERNFCGPGSAANSLHWLVSENDYKLTDSLKETMDELAQNMNNNNSGNWDDAQVEGLEEYIEDNDLPLETHYVGGAKITDGEEITWEWVLEEMKKGQDILFMTGSHWVVVEGVISWDDVHLFAYRDDPYQNGSGTTDAQEEVIEDRHVWSYYNNGRVNIGNGDEALRFVSATSPIIPEPATLTLLTAGLCCLGLRQARPRRR